MAGAYALAGAGGMRQVTVIARLRQDPESRMTWGGTADDLIRPGLLKARWISVSKSSAVAG